jgi:hypothetical protein
MVTGVKQGGDEGIVGEAVLCGHFVEQTAGVAGVERGRATVHEENGIGGREGAWNVPGLEKELVQLSAGGNAAGAEELDAAANVNGDGHHSRRSAGEEKEGGYGPPPPLVVRQSSSNRVSRRTASRRCRRSTGLLVHSFRGIAIVRRKNEEDERLVGPAQCMLHGPGDTFGKPHRPMPAARRDGDGGGGAAIVA